MPNTKKIISLSANSSWYLYNFRASTIKSLIENNFTVVCLVPNDSYLKNLETLGCKCYKININPKGQNPFSDFLLCIQFFYFYCKLRPSVAMHFTIKNNIYGTFGAYLANVPSINNVTGLGTAFINKNIISRIVSFLYKVSQRCAAEVFCQNPEDLELLKIKKLVPSEKLILIPGSGVDTQKFHPKLKSEYQDLEKAFTFLYAGRMLADKGLYELINAFAFINRSSIVCKLWLCGLIDKNNKSAIPSDVIEGWKKFAWVEWKGPSSSIEKIMAQVDCLVLPSYREGMPRSILEASSMALPIIATDVAGCKHIIKHKENGLLCKPKDSISLQNSIMEMLDLDLEKRSTMGKRGREIVVNQFDEQIVIQKTLKSISNII
jgi:glycosyltransferase involved in cell wall biosynthesis